MLLQGLNVVEMSTWVAGPSCAAIMAEWGADAIKVEAPAGDPTRHLFPAIGDSPGNPISALENRGKRSIALDLKNPADSATMRQLLQRADIFVTNLRPGALQRAGLAYADVQALAPRLIYASISGFGLSGPDRDLPAFDLSAFWNRSGIAASTIPPDQEPFACRPGLGDQPTALAALSAILAALHERHSSGKGRLIEISLLRTAAYAIGWDLSILLRNGEVVTARPRADLPNPMAGYFRTSDARWLYIAARSANCFPTLMRTLGLAQLLDDPANIPPIADLARVRGIRAEIDARIGALTLAQAGKLLTEADLIWTPMATLAELVADPQAQAAGCFVTIPDGKGGEMQSVAMPARFPEGAPAPQRPAPRLDEHRAEILASLGDSAGIQPQ